MSENHSIEGSSLERAGYLDRGIDGSGRGAYNEKTGERVRLRRPVISEDGLPGCRSYSFLAASRSPGDLVKRRFLLPISRPWRELFGLDELSAWSWSESWPEFPSTSGFVRAGVLPSPFAPVLQGDLSGARSDRSGLRVLFIGNSSTYYNAMPQMVQKLAAGDPEAQTVFSVSYTAPGWSLRSASRDDRLADLIRDVPWDTIVLQEHSVRASASVDRRSRQTDPYVRDLQGRIAARGARPLLFMTWPYHETTDLAGVLGLPVAPVTPALVEAYRRRPDLGLWLPDGHTNRAGSFLAACVFYVVLTKRDPSDSSFTAGLPESDARFLESVAAELLGNSK